jgi:hypothetical protein
VEPAVHPFLAQRQRGGALGIGGIVALDHPLDRIAQVIILGSGKMTAQEIGDGEVVLQIPEHGMQLRLVRIVRVLARKICAVKSP